MSGIQIGGQTGRPNSLFSVIHHKSSNSLMHHGQRARGFSWWNKLYQNAV